jgi:hypothetical protein
MSTGNKNSANQSNNSTHSTYILVARESSRNSINRGAHINTTRSLDIGPQCLNGIKA